MRKLIINADDLGITPQRSHGIFMCAEQGVVSSVSVIPNGSDSDAAARHARERNISAGLHLNFTEGSALCKASDILSLLTTDKYFLGRDTLLRVLGDGGIDPKHIEREARAQIEWFLEHCGHPTHVDSHHHMHVHPAIAPILAPIFDRYGIAFVRIPSEPPLPFGYQIEEARSAYIRAISEQAESARKIFAAHGLRFADNFRGFAMSGSASMRNLRHTLARLPEGITELMTHPGSPAATGDAFEMDPQRVTELRMLTNPETVALLKEREVTLCSYADVL